MQIKKRWLLPVCCIILAGCNNKEQNKPNPTPVTKDTITFADHSKPDPKIAVKEDYSKLTEEEMFVEDITHLDISYFPSNYALDKATGKKVDLKIRILYSRVNKLNRPIVFGDASIRNVPVPYGKVWRLGANESTEIELLCDVEINGQKLKKGRYTVFAIPYPDKWTIIFNKDLYTWGAFNYNEKNNVATADVPVEKKDPIAERLYIYFQKTTNGANMIMTWDNVRVTLPITILQ